MTRRLLTVALAALVLAPLTLVSAAAPGKTLKGQVVCGGCWDEVPDRHKEPYGTKADLECAARCEKNGVAAALAVDDGKTFRLYELAPGSFKPEGKGWLKYMGKDVEVTGAIDETAKKPRLVVDSLKVVEKK
jgi:hypothetical protein